VGKEQKVNARATPPGTTARATTHGGQVVVRFELRKGSDDGAREPLPRMVGVHALILSARWHSDGPQQCCRDYKGAEPGHMRRKRSATIQRLFASQRGFSFRHEKSLRFVQCDHPFSCVRRPSRINTGPALLVFWIQKKRGMPTESFWG